jgi:SpoVK/Ycf46/Vps4 family AAA+-type ATPase
MADSTSLRRSTDVMCVAPRHERDALIDVVTGTPGGFGLLPALQRLDALLTRAADAAAEIYGPEAATDPYRGLVIGPDEFARLLRRDPGEPLFSADDPDADPPAVRGRELAWIGRAFDLTPFDLDLLIVAIAPELDLRYERLYAYLQDDATRRRPTVDLALNLLCGSAGERIEARSRVAADAPLLRHRLLHLVVDPNQPHQPLLARAMKVDEQVLRLTLGESTLDPRLASCAELAPARRPLASLTLDPAIRRALPLRAIRAVPQSPQPRLYFHGPPGAGQRAAAEALATEARLPLLVVDLDRAGRSETPAEEIIRIAFREAWFRRSAIFLTGADALRDEPGRVARERLLEEISTSRVLTVLAGREAWAPSAHVLDRPTGVAVVPFPVPDVATRRESWERALTAAGIDVDGEVVATLAVHHRLTVSRIAEAVSSVRNRVDWTGGEPSAAELFAAARAQSGQDLAAFARRIDRVYRWDDLILPDDALSQLRELRNWVAQRERVLREWGFDGVLALGRGICALFAGPSGTGKTMAADVLAGELELDLYKIDLATVVSKYIGETEKNLERVFVAAESANAVLFFDEADAIFGKRSEVRDAHDRYANIEIAYLLQRMEQYDGIAILATNLRENLDDAFLRRLHFIIEFPMPDEAHRERMWRQFLPTEAPVDGSIDYSFLARQFRLAGGNIKNIVLSAAFLAAASGGRIGMPHLIRATWREHQKMGRVLSEVDIGDYATALHRGGEP